MQDLVKGLQALISVHTKFICREQQHLHTTKLMPNTNVANNTETEFDIAILWLCLMLLTLITDVQQFRFVPRLIVNQDPVLVH